MYDWLLQQLDVRNAFLNGNLTEIVFMEQSPGFIDDRFPTLVCCLKKALYGLKQGHVLVYLLVYVDDIILMGNDTTFFNTFVAKLHQEFSIKDLGALGYFLGLEVTHKNHSIFLTQTKYAYDILARAGLVDAKPVTTPLSSTEVFLSKGELFHDPILYKSLVGALQYLTITRPDLSCAVNQASQHLQSPTVSHFQSVKRILRYVKGTFAFGLHFSKESTPTLLGYSDVDWARCIETRRCSYGYSIYLGGNLVSWSAKKQPTVARSSCESEYRAMANTATKIIWLTHLLRELHALPMDVQPFYVIRKELFFSVRIRCLIKEPST
ncbi:uncharacterized mitochondrial protein AtMg00810-like [Helianthus annuus]|uniref:uncharacterized mitochondrial protein AtMg00810-like n=1 Tax=Helianthus annuus TaxID=4232 RepID=UPI000B8F38EC|nr:uncharacterized mitochondrial protein AtMg00810-like [Helianthus annuus]